MDYVPHGDLDQLISKHKQLDEDTVKVMAWQLLSALKYLHSMGVIHRDVKPDHILIQSYDPMHVKLTNCSLSKLIEDTDETFSGTFCGTLLYCAPEMYTEYPEYDAKSNHTHRGKDKRSAHAPRYGHAVDLWSLGSVLFYALCGSPPYPAKSATNYQELLKSIITKPLDIRPLQSENISEHGIEFVSSMLQVQPEDRPTIDQLEASPWLANIGQIASSGKTPAIKALEESPAMSGLNRTHQGAQIGLDAQKTNKKAESKQNPRPGDHPLDTESMQTRPPTDSGYASAMHDKFEHTQNARAEDCVKSNEDVQSRPPTDEEYVPTTNTTYECAQNPKDIESDDVRTVYSDTLSLSDMKNESYISQFAYDLFSKVRSEQADGQTMERIFGVLPDLLKAFAYKVGHNAPTQMHLDVMFFVHKYRR
jgi:serine/threonine protein kinase